MYRRAAIVVLLVLSAFATATVAGARQGPNGPGGPTISWSPERLAIDGPAGSEHQAEVVFRASGQFEDIDVWVNPGLDEIIIPDPDHLGDVSADTGYKINFEVVVPDNAKPDATYEGTLHLRDGNRTLARPLRIEINVTDEPDVALHTFSMIAPIGEGSVEPSAGTHTYPNGTEIELHATPDPGWVFDSWIVNDEQGPDSPSVTLAINDDVSAQAVFLESPVVQTVEPGGMVTGADGVTFGAPEGSLAEAIDIEIQQVEDPTTDVPLPDGWNDGGVEIAGHFYELRASRQVSTPHGHYFTIGLPIPEGASTDDLAVAVLSPPGSVISHGDVEPSMRWHTQRGQYDESSGLFGTIVPFTGTEPRVYALVQGAGFSDVELPEDTGVASVAPLSEQEFGGFQVECVNNFRINPCTPEHQSQTEDALNAAYDAWVQGLGFDEPRLQHTLVEIDFSSDEAPAGTVLYSYDYLLSFHESRNGAYAIEDGIGVTFFPSDDAYPDPDDVITRHELFHALQYGYPNTFDNRDSAVDGIVEGAATAAEMSLDRLTRSNRTDFPGREPRHVDIGILRDISSRDTDAYATQDFWVYLGRRLDPLDPQISFLIPLFERGSQRSDLDQMLRDDGAFESLSDVYWQWVRNQSFEKTQPLGQDGDGNSIPALAQCDWSGHGTLEPVGLAVDISFFSISFDLDPLSSTVFEVTLQPGQDPRSVQAAIDATEVSSGEVAVKFYLPEDAGTDACVGRPENHSHTVDVDEGDETFHILVSNTHMDADASGIELEFSVVEDLILQAPDGSELATFGNSIAVVGDKILVGAPGHGAVHLEPIWGTGQAYLFESNGSHLRTFAAPDAQDGARFGGSVAAVGDKILIGAPAHDTSAGDNAGQVYLFDADGVHLQTFTAPDGQEFANFGSAITALGEIVVIAADRHATSGGIFAGQVYLFDSNGNHLNTLALPEGGTSSGFGRSLATVGENLLIGTSLGRAYLFDTDGNHLHTFEDPDSSTLSWFGVSVEGIGENVLIGAPSAQLSPGFDAGRVYLYDIDGNLLQSFTAPDAQEGADFGRRIVSAGENVLVGAPHHDTDAGRRAGQAYLFAPGGALLETYVAPDAQAAAQFGGALASMGDRIFVGARQHDTAAGVSAGQVYLFALSGQSAGE